MPGTERPGMEVPGKTAERSLAGEFCSAFDRNLAMSGCVTPEEPDLHLLSRYLYQYDAQGNVTGDGENRYRYACDELGSVTHVTDEAGAVLNRYTYDAFGNRTSAEETVGNRFGFTGELLDGLTGQYYLRARFYSPAIGRFLQEDTYYGDGLNLYSYCQNNPVKYVDPSGHNGCPKEGLMEGKNRPEPEQPGSGKIPDGESGNLEGLDKSINVGKFPENPDDLLPEIPRDKVVKSNGGTSQKILTSDNVRIRAETHPMEPGETYNPRHHGQHYHIEYKIDSNKGWNNKNNVQKVYPLGYTKGSGTGFLPGEDFPN